jgi:hypothetical protein
LLSLLALFAMPAIVQATQPATKCEAGFATNCTMAGVGANQTIYAHVNFSPGVSPTLPTDTFLLTFTQIRCDSWTDGRGGEHTCAYYAHTGSHSGSDTVTLSASNTVAFVGSYAASDVIGTGSPADSTCFATGTVPTSNSSFTTCSITTTQTNDVYNYMVNTSVGASCNFTAVTGATNGPTVQIDALANTACNQYLVNDNFSTNLLIPSGPPQTVTLGFNSTNSGGSAGTFGVQIVTLLPGNTGSAKRKHPPYIIKNRVPTKPGIIRVSWEDYR